MVNPVLLPLYILRLISTLILIINFTFLYTYYMSMWQKAFEYLI